MSENAQQEAVWVFPPPRKRNGGKLAFIIVLAIVALAIVGGFLYFLVWKDDGETTPSPSSSSASPSTSLSPSESASPSPGASDSATPVPTPTDGESPVPSTDPSTDPAPEPSSPETEPPAVDPDLEAFTTEVTPPLDAAVTGLTLASQTSGEEAASFVDQLLQDAQRLSDTAPPASLGTSWTDAVTAYAGSLQELGDTYRSGGDASIPLANAQASVSQIRALLGI